MRFKQKESVMSFITVCFALWALAWFGLVVGFDYRIRE